MLNTAFRNRGPGTQPGIPFPRFRQALPPPGRLSLTYRFPGSAGSLTYHLPGSARQASYSSASLFTLSKAFFTLGTARMARVMAASAKM